MRTCQLLTTDDIYRADAETHKAGVSGFQLMENAGAAVTREIVRRWQPRRTVICCGPGNNGGDGFVIARRLAEAGWPVQVRLLGALDSLSGDAALAAQTWAGTIVPLTADFANFRPLVVDALFGAGLSRTLTGIALEVVRTLNKNQLTYVAVDVPSGVDGNRGTVLGDAVRAALTVTFFRAKPGHALMPAREYIGDLVVADIGISDTVITPQSPPVFLNGPELWAESFAKPAVAAHKYTRGHLLVAGGQEMTGAARLAAHAARRVGVGLVTITSHPESWLIYASDRAGLLVKKVETIADYQVLFENRRINGFVIGPGFGRGPSTQDLVRTALATRKPVVLDADAISAFADNPEDLFDQLHANCLLTPHEGEFTRIFGFTGNNLERARDAAHRSRAVVLLKGADTVIAEPSGRAAINTTGTPYLATAGTGDVLAGLIGGLMGQGMRPFDAASAAAWMHGKAAEIHGPGLIAEDISELIPEITTTIINLSFPAP